MLFEHNMSFVALQ